MRPGGGVGLGQLAREAAEDVRFRAGSGRRNFFGARYPGRQLPSGARFGSVGLTLGPGRVRIPVQNRVDFAGSARPPEGFRLSWLGTLDTLGPSSLRRQARGCVRAFCCAQVKLTSHSSPFVTGPMWGPPWAHCLPTAEGPFPAFPGPSWGVFARGRVPPRPSRHPALRANSAPRGAPTWDPSRTPRG